MDSLTLSYEPDPEDCVGQLFARVRTALFPGYGFIWAQPGDLEKFAAKLEAHPLTPDDPPTLRWGYNECQGDFASRSSQRTGAGGCRAFDPLRTFPIALKQMTAEPMIVEAATSADRTKRWELVRREDEFFVYSEDTYSSEDLREFGSGIEEYWSPTHLSGLFDTAEAAKAYALGTLPWLKAINPAP